jgi:hypothetical protein
MSGGAGHLGFRASLQPWYSFLNRFAECATCPEGGPSTALKSRSSGKSLSYLSCGEGKGHPEQCGRIKLHSHEKYCSSCFVAVYIPEWTEHSIVDR